MSMADKILLIGDIINDVETIIRRRASFEKPEPEHGSWEIVSSKKKPGGVLNVGRHLSNLEADYYLFPVHEYFYDTVKERFFDENGKKLFKMNKNSSIDCSFDEYHDFIKEEISDEYNKIVIVDMERKAVTNEVAKMVMSSGKQVFVDIQKRFAVEKIDFSPWNGATIFPNSTELNGVRYNYVGSIYSKLGQSGVEFYNWTTNTDVFEEGIKLSDFGYEVFDTVGAGDAFLAAIVAGKTLEFANRYAAFSITKQASQLYNNKNQYMEEFDAFERKVLGK